MPSLTHKKPDGTEKSLELGTKPVVVGRLPESDVSVRDSFISRVHCGITWADNQYTLKDLGSTNGTYRNGARVYECILATGDKIQVGNTTLVFEIDDGGQAALRQVPQMVAPPRTQPSPIIAGQKGTTVPVQPPLPPRPPSLGPK